MAAVVLLQPVPAMAVLVYLHSFDDLTDIVDTSTGTSSVGVSSDFAVDGSNSLRFDIVGTKKAIMLLTPQIGGGNNTDDTVTMVSRYRTETAVDDYMQMQVNNDFNILTVRGYPAGDFRFGPIEATQFFVIYDRSGVTQSTDQVRIVGVYKIN